LTPLGGKTICISRKSIEGVLKTRGGYAIKSEEKERGNLRILRERTLYPERAHLDRCIIKHKVENTPGIK